MRINKFLYFGDFFAIPLALALFACFAYRHGGARRRRRHMLSRCSRGIVVWTLAEYWIHRTLYHQAPVFSTFHDRHHAQPKAFIGLPSFLSSGIVVVLGYGPFCRVRAGVRRRLRLRRAARLRRLHGRSPCDASLAARARRLAIRGAGAPPRASLSRRRRFRHRHGLLGSRFRHAPAAAAATVRLGV